MKRLSKYRRHPLAAALVIGLGLLLVGGIYSFASPASSAQAINARGHAGKEGQQIFLRGCSSCHGINAQGTKIAPSLIGVGAASVDFQVGTGRMPMADASVQAVAKAPQYTPEQTLALAEYVASFGAWSCHTVARIAQLLTRREFGAGRSTISHKLRHVPQLRRTRRRPDAGQVRGVTHGDCP